MPATEQGVALPARYRVVRHIASGGMASVWEAEDELLGRLVAVKVLSRALDADERARSRFLREARAAAKLGDCRHVVTVYDLGEHQGRAFIVMAHLAGGTVADRLRAGTPIPRAQAVRWLREAAAALDCAHGHHVVHRDVKPANLLLDKQGALAVGDFGIATVASEASITQTGQVLGTAAYISPEQARGENATAASDRYALAVVAYELLTGARPFQAEHPAAQARAHVEATVPDASAVARLPAAVGTVLQAGMAKAPEERPASAGDLVDRLEGALGGAEPDPTAATRRLEAVPAPVAPASRPREAAPSPASRPRDAAPSPASRPREARWPRTAASPPTPRPTPATGGPPRRTALLAALAALALAAGAIAAIALTGGDGGSERAGGERTGGERTSSGADRGASSSSASTADSRSTQSQPSTSSSQSSASTSSQRSSSSGSDPKALNDRGFALIQQGNPTAAVEPLQGAVKGFRNQDRTDEIDYAFALFNLGNSLRLIGRPAEAIPFLEERLEVSDYKRGVVRRELALARQQAGQPVSGNGNGNGDGDGG